MVRPLIVVDPDSPTPLYQQLTAALEEAIARGDFDEEPLPSTRRLAQDLDVSRNTVISAYDQLMSQGLIEAVPRKGLYVAPDAVVRLRVSRHDRADPAPRHDWLATLRPPRLSSAPVAEPAWSTYPYPFRSDQPDASLFPVGAWERASREALQPAGLVSVLADADGGDDPLLVRQICTEIAPTRGMRPNPAQVMVTLGTRQALHLLSLVLVEPGSRVLVEDPGSADARNIFSLAGADVRAAPVDDEGLAVESLEGVDVVYVTPSHQYPTTVTMSLRRREHLLDLAAHSGTIVIEDDQDAELVFRGTPIAAMKALDSADRVVYFGSFATTLAPGLRLGYVVAAPELIAAMRDRARYSVLHPPGQVQRALAHLIESRDYTRHVRRLRKHYRRRWEEIAAAVAEEFSWLPQRLPRGGLAVWVAGPAGLDTTRLYDAARDKGVLIEPVGSCFFRAPAPNPYFRLGFRTIPPTRIRDGVRVLAECIAGTA